MSENKKPRLDLRSLRKGDSVLMWVAVKEIDLHGDLWTNGAWVEAGAEARILDAKRLIKLDDKVTCQDLIGEATVLAVSGENAWVQFDDTGKFPGPPVTKPLSQLTRV